MGNDNFIRRNIYKSTSLNEYINELVKANSLKTGIHSETVWKTTKAIADLNNLNLERFDEPVIKQILKQAQKKYPVVNLVVHGATSLDQLKRWETDGVFEELKKVFDGKESALCSFENVVKCGDLRIAMPVNNKVFMDYNK